MRVEPTHTVASRLTGLILIGTWDFIPGYRISSLRDYEKTWVMTSSESQATGQSVAPRNVADHYNTPQSNSAVHLPATQSVSDKKNQNTSPPPPVSFEHALERLGEVVRDLEEGNLTLDESLARYEEGIRFLNQCQQMLSAAERKIEILRGFDSAGNPIAEPLADDEMTLEQKADTRSRRRSARSEVHDVSDEVVERNDAQASRHEPNDVDFRDTLF